MRDDSEHEQQQPLLSHLHIRRPRSGRGRWPDRSTSIMPALGPHGQPARIEIRLLGSIEVRQGCHRLGPRAFGGTKAKQVFELLLISRGHTLTKDHLVERLWGEALPKHPFATLENHISILRRHLEVNAKRRRLIVTEPGGYRLVAEAVDLDLDRFDERIAAAAGFGSRVARRVMGEALDLGSRGEVLEDEPYPEWAEELRRTYRTRTLGIRLDSAELALAEGDTRAALDHARAAMAIDPYGERAHRLAMLAHYAEGDQQSSLADYQRLRSLLAEDLGLEPTPETRQIESAVLAQEDAASLLLGRLQHQVRSLRPRRARWSGAGRS